MNHNLHLSRRQFLKTSLAGAALFPTIIPSSVLGADAPSKKIQIGQIGCGHIANEMDMPGLLRQDAARIVADGLRFPNGIAISADNSRLVVAEMDGECLAEYDIEADGGLTFRGRLGHMKSPDGICLDQNEAVWVASFDEDAFIRLDRDGRELQRIDVPGRRAIACALGGPERRTLFCLSAATSYEQLRQGKSSARIDVVDVEISGAGYP